MFAFGRKLSLIKKNERKWGVAVERSTPEEVEIFGDEIRLVITINIT